MIKKPIKNLIQTAFILILGFVLTICTVSAETSTNGGTGATTTNSPTKETKVGTSLKKSNQLVNIVLSTEDTSSPDKTTRKYRPLIGKKLTYWRISDALTGTSDEIENRKVSIVNRLRLMKYKDIVKEYGVPDSTGVSNLDGLISLEMKNDSLYYFMESATNSSIGPIVASFVLNMPKDEVGTIDVQSKNTGTEPPEKPNTGIKKFVKVDESTKARLADAWFKVSIKKSDGKYYAVKRDGVDYMVNSDKNGNFEVTGLDLGVKYYLVEVKSPTGYSQLAAPVEFTVDPADSIKQTEKVIGNKPNPYEKIPNNTNNQGDSGNGGGSRIVVPKTGDIMLLLLVIAGGLVSSLGVLMVRDNRKHIAEQN